MITLPPLDVTSGHLRVCILLRCPQYCFCKLSISCDVLCFRYPQYIQAQLEKLPLAELQRKEAAILVKYLSFMMKLYTLRAADLKQKGEICSGYYIAVEVV